MTQLLDRAIARARALSDVEQDEAAELLLWAMGDPRPRVDDGALAFNAGMEKARRIERSAHEPAEAFADR